jgi:uncharacterized protein YndB with AHSA1/START domain
VAASADRVYAALTDRDALAQWLPPDGMSGAFEKFDARPGGGYRLVLTYADSTASAGKSTAGTDVVEVCFVELVPDARVVQAIDFESDDPAYAGTMTMIWSLSQAAGGTLVEIRADDVPAGISEADHTTGMASSLDHLATYLERS